MSPTKVSRHCASEWCRQRLKADLAIQPVGFGKVNGHTAALLVELREGELSAGQFGFGCALKPVNGGFVIIDGTLAGKVAAAESVLCKAVILFSCLLQPGKSLRFVGNEAQAILKHDRDAVLSFCIPCPSEGR